MDKNNIVYAKDVLAKLDIFKVWLSEHGAEVLQPAVKEELVRFNCDKGMSILYATLTGARQVSFYGEAETAWTAFRKGNGKWRAFPATKRSKDHTTHAIRRRDGNNCFFCNQLVLEKDESVEHLISLTHGGSNHLANKFLAHQQCNNEAQHLSAVEKINIRVQAILKKESIKWLKSY